MSAAPRRRQSSTLRIEWPIFSFRSHSMYSIDSTTLSAQGVIFHGVRNSRSTSEEGAISARP